LSIQFPKSEWYYETALPTPRSEIFTVRSFGFVGLASISGRTGSIVEGTEERGWSRGLSGGCESSVSTISWKSGIATSMLFGWKSVAQHENFFGKLPEG